jgi:hypothetical protein
MKTRRVSAFGVDITYLDLMCRTVFIDYWGDRRISISRERFVPFSERFGHQPPPRVWRVLGLDVVYSGPREEA